MAFRKVRADTVEGVVLFGKALHVVALYTLRISVCF